MQPHRNTFIFLHVALLNIPHRQAYQQHGSASQFHCSWDHRVVVAAVIDYLILGTEMHDDGLGWMVPPVTSLASLG